MFLYELIDAVAGAGYGPDTIDGVYRTIFQRYPSTQAEVYSQPMSTAQDDPWLPEEFVDELLAELGIQLETVA